MKNSDIQVSTKTPLNDFAFRENNQYYWWASWYAKILGYKSFRTFKPTIERAENACMQLGLDVSINFISEKNHRKQDMKLTKFACFMIAQHADSRKDVVRKARAYFRRELESFDHLYSQQGYLTRMIAREETKQLHRQLKRFASRAHVKDFQYFMNEGYLGMYNHTVAELRVLRGVSSQADLFDLMGINEMAANNLRITLTMERLKKLRNPSEIVASKIHWSVGAEIRALIQRNTGSYPEYLPMAKNLEQLTTQLKSVQKYLNENHVKGIAHKRKK